MNWKKIKKDFPKSHSKLLEYYMANKHQMTDSMIMSSFLIGKGYNAYPTWIHSLRKYEECLREFTVEYWELVNDGDDWECFEHNVFADDEEDAIEEMKKLSKIARNIKVVTMKTERI